MLLLPNTSSGSLVGKGQGHEGLTGICAVSYFTNLLLPPTPRSAISSSNRPPALQLPVSNTLLIEWFSFKYE